MSGGPTLVCSVWGGVSNASRWASEVLLPGCYFRVAGTEFDPDVFLASTPLDAYSVWHVGEPLAKVGPRASQFRDSSGFACDVSSVDRDLDGQLQDAIAFLSANRADLARLDNDPAIQDRRLAFGYDCRLDDDNVAVQGEWLPVDFLQLVAELKIGVALLLFPRIVDDA